MGIRAATSTTDQSTHMWLDMGSQLYTLSIKIEYVVFNLLCIQLVRIVPIVSSVLVETSISGLFIRLAYILAQIRKNNLYYMFAKVKET